MSNGLKKYKILLGVHQFFPEHTAGTEVLTLELARGLREKGHEVEIITCVAESSLKQDVKPWLTKDVFDDFVVHRLHFGARGNFFPISNDYECIARVGLVLNLVLNYKPHIVHFNHVIGFSAAVIPAIRRLGIPVVFTPTDFWVVCPKIVLFQSYKKQVCDSPDNGVKCVECFIPIPKTAAKVAYLVGQTPLNFINWRLKRLKSLGKRVNNIVNFVNDANKILPATKFLENVLKRHKVKDNLLKVVPYGVDIGLLPKIIPIPEKFSLEEKLKIGFIGSIYEMKGLHILLDALLNIPDYEEKVSLDVYGPLKENDIYCQEVVKKAGELKVEVSFKGTFPHEKIGEVLRGMHLLVVPSIWYESTPLVLCSGLSAGIPVAVSSLGGMTEIVKEGVNGFIFTGGSPKDLGLLLTKLIENPSILVKVYNNKNIRKRTTKDYTNDIEAEYLSLLNN